MESKAQLTVDIIAKVVEGVITIANAAKLLSKSRRSIERYVKRYQQVAIQSVVHGNSGILPPNKTPVSIKKAVHAEFFHSETIVGCLKVMRDCIETLAESWVLKLFLPIYHKVKVVLSEPSIPSKTL